MSTTKFKVGDKVRLMTSEGSGIGEKDDIAIVTSMLVPDLLRVTFLTGKDKGLTSSRYIARYALINEDWDT